MKSFLLVIFSTLFFTSAFAHNDGSDHEKCHDEEKVEWTKGDGDKGKCCKQCNKMHEKHQEMMKALIKECLDGATIKDGVIQTNC